MHYNLKITYFHRHPVLWWGCHAVYVWVQERTFSPPQWNIWKRLRSHMTGILLARFSIATSFSENFLLAPFNFIFCCLAFVCAHRLNLQYEALHILRVIALLSIHANQVAISIKSEILVSALSIAAWPHLSPLTCPGERTTGLAAKSSTVFTS